MGGALAQECGDFAGNYYWTAGSATYVIDVEQKGCDLSLFHPYYNKTYSGNGGAAVMTFPDPDENETHVGHYNASSGKVFWGDDHDDRSQTDFWFRGCVPLARTYFKAEAPGSDSKMEDEFIKVVPTGMCAYSIWVPQAHGEWEHWNATVKDWDVVVEGNMTGSVSEGASIDWQSSSSWRALRATPCGDFSQFEPRAELWHCAGDEDVTDPAVCASKGCTWNNETTDDDRCHCDEDTCERGGFSWDAYSCSDVVTGNEPFQSMDAGKLYGGMAHGEKPWPCHEEETMWSVMYLADACCRDKISFCGSRPQPPPKCDARLSGEQWMRLREMGLQPAPCM